MGSPLGAQVDAAMAAFNKRHAEMFKQPDQPTGPRIAFSQSKNRMFVNGLEFDAKDASSALESEKYLSAPAAEGPQGDDWTDITPDEYNQYLETIKNPDLGRLAGKNFEIGMNNLGALYGAGLQFVGMEKEGSAMVAEATKNLGYMEPFQRTVEKSDSVIDWFVANFAQQGPNIIESILVAGAGALVGTATAGPLAGGAEALAGLFAKESYKTALRKAVVEYAAAKAAKDKLRMEAAKAVIRPAAAALGAAAFTAADNYRMGVSDIYGELRGNGVDAGDMGARLAAMGGAVPYAALESLPEAVLGLKILGKLKGSGGFVSRATKGFAAGGALEGVTETGQEAILINTGKAFGHTYASDEELSRYINSFAAGFAVGGPIGGVVGAFDSPTDLIKAADKNRKAGLTTPDDTPTGPAGPTDGGFPRPPGSAPTEAELLDRGERSFMPAEYPVWPGPKPRINRGTGGTFGEIGPFGSEQIDGRAPPAATPQLMGPLTGQDAVTPTTPTPSAPAAPTTQTPQPTPPGAQGAVPVRPSETDAEVQIALDNLQQQTPVSEQPTSASDVASVQTSPQQSQVDLLKSPQFQALVNEAKQTTAALPAKAQIANLRGENQDAIQPDLPLPRGQLALRRRKVTPVAENSGEGGIVTPDGLKGPEQLELPYTSSSLKKSRSRASAKGKAAADEAAKAAAKKAADKDEADQKAIDREHQNVLAEAQRREALARADAAELEAQALRDKEAERKAKIKAAAEKLKAKPKSIMDETDAFSAKRTKPTPREAAEEKASGPKPLTTAAKERARRAAAKAEQGGGSSVTPTPVNTPENKVEKPKKPRSLTLFPKEQLKQRLAEEERLQSEAIAAEKANETQPVQSPSAEVEKQSPANRLKRKAEAVAGTEPTGSTPTAGEPAVAAAEDKPAGPAASGQAKKGVAALSTSNEVTRWAAQEAELMEHFKAPAEIRDTQHNLEELRILVSDDDGLLDMAFFTDKSDVNTAAPKSDPDQRNVKVRAQEFLKMLVGGDGKPGIATEAQRQVIYDEFVSEVRTKTRYAATKGVERAWYAFAKDPIHNLLPRIDLSRVRAVPASDKILFGSDNSAVLNPSISEVSTKPEAVENQKPVIETPKDETKAATKQLIEIINTILSGNLQANSEVRLQMRTLFEKADATAQVGDRVMGGKPVVVGQFFDEGKVKFKKLPNGKYVLSASTGKDVVSKFFRSGVVSNPMPVGNVQMVAHAFIEKLQVKPKLRVFANIADMKARAPELYAEANNRGGFDNTQAAGISFNDKVVLFTNHLANAQHVKFVVAHETIGHFGFRSIMPQAQLNRMLQQAYDSDYLVRLEADRKAHLNNIDKIEAVEEVLADMAGRLDNSLLSRVWAHIKTALNKLGLKFGDELARHIVFQSRRYVRNGATSVFGEESLRQAMQEMAARSVVTRYSRAADEATIAGHSVHIGNISQETAWSEFDKLATNFKEHGANALKNVGKITRIIETLGHKAQRSEGLQKVFHLFQQQSALSKALKTSYLELTKLTRTSGLQGGPTTEQLAQADKLLAYVALNRSQNLSMKTLHEDGALIVYKDGVPTIDTVALQELINKATPTLDEIKSGIKFKLGGKEETFSIPDLTEQSPVWKVFLEQRAAVNQAAADKLLYKYRGLIRQRQVSFNALNRIKDDTRSPLTEEDKKWLRDLSDLYGKIYYTDSVTEDGVFKPNLAATEKADEFIKSILMTLHDDYKDKESVREWFKDSPASDSIAAKFTGPEFDAAKAYIKNFGRFDADGKFERLRTVAYKQQLQILNIIRDTALSTGQLRNAVLFAKSTILTNYVPFKRNGKTEIKLVATDSNGRVVKLSEEMGGNLPYFKTDDPVVEKRIIKEANAAFGNRTYKVLDNDDKEVEVTFHVESQDAQETQTLATSMDFDEFIRVVTRLNIDLKPAERYNIVNALATHHSAARRNLERTGTPGWDPNIIKGVSEHLEMEAHTSARNLYRFELTDILLDNDLWLGSRDKLAKLRANISAAKNPQAKFLAEQDYSRYAYMMEYMAARGSGPIERLSGGPVEPKGEGRSHQEAAKKLIRWYSENTDITDTPEDALSGPLGSRVKMAVVASMLGGSIATAAVNLVSLATHTIPTLAFYNRTRGFGGGFGMAAATAETFKALRQVTDLKTGRVADLEEMLRTGSYAAHGLTRDEAYFLLRESKQGVLDAAAVNSLIASARGGITSRALALGLEKWMAPFSTTERVNRRATALAAYRLHKARAAAAGSDMTAFNSTDHEKLQFDPVFEALSQEAVNTVNNSQGEYAMYNRPALARGPLMNMLFVFKMYPILTAEMLSSLPRSGVITVLGTLFVLAGYKGLPFADDIMDLIDTLCQKLGITKHDLEQDILELSESMVPGSGRLLQRGIVDYLLGSTVSTKVGLGDMVPLTGIGREGANFPQEVENFLGPVWTTVTGGIQFTGDVAKLGAETVGLSDKTSNPGLILRNAPVTAIRSLADAFSYQIEGRVTDTKGRVVTDTADLKTVVTRALGFYPGEATRQNDAVRMAKHADDYSKAIKARYVVAYADAKLKGDSSKMTEIANDVREWNQRFKGTEFEIRDFIKAANRSADERGRGTAERYLKSASKNIRPSAERVLSVLGYDADELGD